MRVSQAEFISAVLDPKLPTPEGLIGGSRGPTRRFSVYRNNVVVGLTDAMESSFPVIRKLLGDEFFRAMCGVFVRQFPPTSPVLWQFGSELPEFIETFPPLADFPYLPDMARLENLLRESYHEADAKPVSADAVSEIPADRLSEVRMRLAPSTRLLRSRHPVCSIWRANAAGGPKPSYAAEDVLIVRREFDPEPVLLPPGGHEIVSGLSAGASLLEACDRADTGCGEARLDETLTLLVRFGAITAVAVDVEARWPQEFEPKDCGATNHN